MKSLPFRTPVLLVVFNRPRLAEQVFASIRRARPAKLFIAADGPRADRPGEAALCQEVREIVMKINWDCKVKRRFQASNLGCKRAVASAIEWFFSEVEEGIILEEDCLPSQSFFWFCQELLERWRADERVMQLSGSNFLFGHPAHSGGSYYFSRLNDVWGWATWRRAWRHFDLTMSTFPAFREGNQLENYLPNAAMRAWLMSYWDEAYAAIGGERGDWSSLWQYAIASQNGLTAVPQVHLVANIGIGEEATNTRGGAWQVYGQVAAQDLTEIRHPIFVLPDNEADERRFAVIRQTDRRAHVPYARSV